VTTGTLPRNDRTAISETILLSRIVNEALFLSPTSPVVDDIRSDRIDDSFTRVKILDSDVSRSVDQNLRSIRRRSIVQLVTRRCRPRMYA